MTTKLHAAVDAQGRPVALLLGPGRQADCRRAEDLSAAVGKRPKRVIADKGYDTNALRAALRRKRISAVIPSKKNRKRPRRLDRTWYRQRNRIKRFFNRLKGFRRLATCYEKTAASFLGFSHLFAALC